MYKPFVDRTGEQYGRLTIVEFEGVDKYKNRLWRCKCSCGTECKVSWRELSRGHTKSCGCLAKEILASTGGWNRKPEGVSSFNQLYFTYKKSAKERNYLFSLIENEFKVLITSDCYYCGIKPSQVFPGVKGTNGGTVYNGIDRIDNDKGYCLDNVRSCCKQCNVSKGTLTESEFTEWVKKIYNKFI